MKSAYPISHVKMMCKLECIRVINFGYININFILVNIDLNLVEFTVYIYHVLTVVSEQYVIKQLLNIELVCFSCGAYTRKFVKVKRIISRDYQPLLVFFPKRQSGLKIEKSFTWLDINKIICRTKKFRTKS